MLPNHGYKDVFYQSPRPTAYVIRPYTPSDQVCEIYILGLTTFVNCSLSEDQDRMRTMTRGCTMIRIIMLQIVCRSSLPLLSNSRPYRVKTSEGGTDLELAAKWTQNQVEDLITFSVTFFTRHQWRNCYLGRMNCSPRARASELNDLSSLNKMGAAYQQFCPTIAPDPCGSSQKAWPRWWRLKACSMKHLYDWKWSDY